MAIVALILGAACTDRADTSSAALMLPQAAGARLGMTYDELHRARPKMFMDSGDAVEYVTRRQSNIFHLGGGGLDPRGRVVAVVMDQELPVSDTASYRRLTNMVQRRWTEQAGDPVAVRSNHGASLVWKTRGAELVLVTTTPAQAVNGSRLLRAIVKRPSVPIPELHLQESASGGTRRSGS